MKNCMYDCPAPCFFPFPEACHRSHFSACKAATEQLSPAGAVQIMQCLLQRHFHSCPRRQLTADSIWSLTPFGHCKWTFWLSMISSFRFHTQKNPFLSLPLEGSEQCFLLMFSSIAVHCCT